MAVQEKKPNWLESFENGVRKLDNFFNKIVFIPRFFTALGAGVRAFKNSFLNETPEPITQVNKENPPDEQPPIR